MPKKPFIPQQWEECPDESRMPICNKAYSGDCGNDRDKDVERIVSLIEQQSADIAPSYEEWVKLGFAFVDGYGENGRDYFLRLSSLHAGCTQEAAESQYDKCLRSVIRESPYPPSSIWQNRPEYPFPYRMVKWQFGKMVI